MQSVKITKRYRAAHSAALVIAIAGVDRNAKPAFFRLAHRSLTSL